MITRSIVGRVSTVRYQDTYLTLLLHVKILCTVVRISTTRGELHCWIAVVFVRSVLQEMLWSSKPLICSPGDVSRRQRMGQVDSKVWECGICQWLGSSRQLKVCLAGRAQKSLQRLPEEKQARRICTLDTGGRVILGKASYSGKHWSRGRWNYSLSNNIKWWCHRMYVTDIQTNFDESYWWLEAGPI